MAYTTPRTWVAGEYPTAAQMNANVRDNVAFLANPPSCSLGRNANLSIPNGAWTSVAFNTEAFDTAAMHDTTTNTTRITVPVAGIYVVTGGVSYAANAVGARGGRVKKNASVDYAAVMFEAVEATHGTYLSLSATLKLAAADYLELQTYQDSGGALNIELFDGNPHFAATWVGLG